MGVGGRVLALSPVLIAFLLLGACSTRHVQYQYSPQHLRSEAARRVQSLTPSEVTVPYEVNQELVDRVRASLPIAYSGAEYVRALALSLTDPEGLALAYHSDRTESAVDTVALGYGNCLSLASVLVGIARAMGMRAYYVEASREYDDTSERGSMTVLRRHIAVEIAVDAGSLYVDFSGQMPRRAILRRIDDLEALAHFYNNRGYEHLYWAKEQGTEVSWQEMQRHFDIATRIHPSLVQAWSNLGVAYTHLGDIPAAVRVYRTALVLEPNFAAARRNLANLHASCVRIRRARAVRGAAPAAEACASLRPDAVP